MRPKAAVADSYYVRMLVTTCTLSWLLRCESGGRRNVGMDRRGALIGGAIVRVRLRGTQGIGMLHVLQVSN